MEMTTEEQKIFDGLSEYHKTVMDYSDIIMKCTAKKFIANMPVWMILKIEYLEKNGFTVERKDLGDTLIVESDISGATFEQRLKIWDIET